MKKNTKKIPKEVQKRLDKINDTKKFKYRIEKIETLDSNIQYDLLTIFDVKKKKIVSKKLLTLKDYKTLFPKNKINQIMEQPKPKKDEKINIIEKNANSNAPPTQNVAAQNDTFFSNFMNGIGTGAGFAIGLTAMSMLLHSFNYIGFGYPTELIINDQEYNEYNNAEEDNNENEDNEEEDNDDDFNDEEEFNSESPNYAETNNDDGDDGDAGDVGDIGDIGDVGDVGDAGDAGDMGFGDMGFGDMEFEGGKKKKEDKKKEDKKKKDKKKEVKKKEDKKKEVKKKEDKKKEVKKKDFKLR